MDNWGYCDPIPVNTAPSAASGSATNATAPATNAAAPALPSLWGRGGIRPAGVRQGLLGDCWFLAVGAALAEHPERVRKLFETTGYPSNGFFQVKFYFKG